MPRNRRLLAAALMLSPLPLPASPAISEPTLTDRAESAIRPWVEAGAYQGVVLLAKGEEIVFHRAYGHASLELGVPNDVDTRFQIASVSKPFTATAIQLLAERGRLDLEAPLSDHLPDFPHAGRLTIDHLLTHTSGLPNANSFDEYADWSKDHWSPASTLVEVIAERVDDLQFEPGSRYGYSNSNYNLLAHLIESVSGESFGGFLEKEIFVPAGMTSTGHRGDPATIVPGLATGYSARGARDFERSAYLDWTIKTGNGSLYSTARDLFRFHRVLRDGRLLKAETLERAYGFDRTLGEGERRMTGLGQGWFPGEIEGRRVVTMTGRSPGYTSHLKRFVDDDLFLVVLSNLYFGPPPEMVSGLVSALLELPVEEAADAAALASGPGLQGDELDPFAGRYQFGEDWFVGRTLVRVENRNDHLAVVYLDGANEGYEFVLVSLGGPRFFDRTHGVTVRFDERGGGERPALVYEYGGGKVAEPVG